MSRLFLTVKGGDNLVCTVEKTAADLSQAHLKALVSCEGVDDELDADFAAQTVREAKAWLAQVEEARKEVKQPFLEFGRQIDAVARNLVIDVDRERARVSRLLGAYETEQRRKAEEAERERRRQEAELREKARQEAEEAARKAASTTEEKIIRQEAREAVKAEVAEIREQAAAVAPVKTAGVKLRSSWDIEVVDVEALFKAHPELVDLVPNLTKIRKALTAGVNLPGVIAEKVQSAS